MQDIQEEPGGQRLRALPYLLEHNTPNSIILFLERKSIKNNFILALKALRFLHFPHGNEVHF